MPGTICLIDGHALAYRAYFALTVTSGASTPSASRWITSKGESTAGVFGFTSILLRILEQERYDYIAVAFDTGRTFRHDIYPEYKGTRAKMPDDLRAQMERIRQLVDTFNIPRLEMENYEADDVLGSAARFAVRSGLGVKIFTGDKDLLQLVSDRVIVNLPGRNIAESKDYYANDVVTYLGVRPDQVVDMKALMGDKSDNIPGVPGIGEKTAVTLLGKYDTLDNIYTHLDEVSGAVGKKLEMSRPLAYLSQQLARIDTNLDVSLDLEHARTEHFDPAAVEVLFRDLEFRTLIKRFQAWASTVQKSNEPAPATREAGSGQLSFLAAERTPPEMPTDGPAPLPDGALATEGAGLTYHVVDTHDKLYALAGALNAAERIAFDTETTSTDPMQAELVGISLAIKPGEGYYIPVGHRDELRIPSKQNLPIKDVMEALRPALTNPAIPKLGHNIKYDYVMLYRYGLEVRPLSFDTMIAEWLINPNSFNLGLKKLAWIRLNIQMTEIETLIGKGKNQRTMDLVAVNEAAPYAVGDVDSVLRLAPILEAEWKSKTGPEQDETAMSVRNIFNQIEMPLIPVLAGMEMTGITLDTAFLAKMSAEIQTRILEIEEKVYAGVGMPFNLNSPQQLSHALFDTLQLKIPGRTKRTASGSYSTSAEVLEALRGLHPVIDLVLEYREISKLKSTYIDSLPLEINPRTGRIHTSYNQTGSVTGRIASSDPNLQNIPIRTELGRRVRRAFVAPPGQMLFSVDYSQVELRIVAHMAQDEAMLSAFRAGQDIHTATAAAIFGVPLAQVSKEQRRHAKAINFGLIYGMSAFGLTRTSELTLAEAEEFVETYFKRFPGIKGYLDGIRQQAAQRGFVETLFGRRRYFPNLKFTASRAGLSREEREAINAPIQGTAADIMKIAMLAMPQALESARLDVKILLQVHDELVFECPREQVQAGIQVARKVMENACTLSVPLATEARFGENWGEMEDN